MSSVFLWIAGAVALLLLLPGLGYSHLASAWSPTPPSGSQSLGRADAIAVLFAGFDEDLDGVDRETGRRLDHALGLLDRGLASSLIVSGGNRPGAPRAGARLMAGYLVARGVAAKSIQVDESSYDSLTNLSEIRDIARARGWTKILLVSSAEHLLRISLVARDRLPDGATLVAYPVASCRPAIGPLERWRAANYHLFALALAKALPAPLYESGVRWFRGHRRDSPSAARTALK